MAGALIYSAICSVDGYVADRNGDFSWAAPDEELHVFVNDVERGVGTHLYGRRMYEVMRAWENDDIVAGQPSFVADFAGIWRAADKIVYSATLADVSTERTRVERTFDVDAVRRLKAAASSGLSVGGPTLAAHALEAGLVDECHLFLVPVVVGGGLRALPLETRIPLQLLNERRFASGAVHLHYRLVPRVQ